MTPFMNFISLFGAKGLFSIILSILLILFKKTRKVGICAILAVGISALICNVILKSLVGRPRPYTDSAYTEWWQAVGAHTEKDASFPSGHVNNVTALIVALFLSFGKKKYTFPMLLFPLVMCMSRIYLVVHYPSDVLFALFTGVASAFASFGATKVIYNAVDKKDNKFTNFFKNACILDLFKKNKGSDDV